MTLGYPRKDMFWGLKGQGHRVNNCIFTLMTGDQTDCKVFKLGIGDDLGISYK